MSSRLKSIWKISLLYVEALEWDVIRKTFECEEKFGVVWIANYNFRFAFFGVWVFALVVYLVGWSVGWSIGWIVD